MLTYIDSTVTSIMLLTTLSQNCMNRCETRYLDIQRWQGLLINGGAGWCCAGAASWATAAKLLGADTSTVAWQSSRGQLAPAPAPAPPPPALGFTAAPRHLSHKGMGTPHSASRMINNRSNCTLEVFSWCTCATDKPTKPCYLAANLARSQCE